MLLLGPQLPFPGVPRHPDPRDLTSVALRVSRPRSELWFTATRTRASTATEFTATAPELLTRPGTPRAWRGFETQKQGSRSGVLRPPSRTVHPVGCERLF